MPCYYDKDISLHSANPLVQDRRPQASPHCRLHVGLVTSGITWQ